MPYWTVKELADHLKMDPQAIYRYIRLGVIPHFRVGTQVRFDPKAIDEWVAAGGKREIGGGNNDC